MSRLDQFLDDVCLFKTRSAAAKAIDAGRVRVDGEVVKRSYTVSTGHVIEIDDVRRVRTVEVLAVPAGSISKKDTDRYVRIVRDAPVDPL
jgi:ribosomal 50S subunit-recycling heat shock protein